MRNKLNYSQTAKSTEEMSLTHIISEPLLQVLKSLIKEALFEVLEECIVSSAGTAGSVAAVPSTAPASCDLNGALEYLNANGFTISKGQVYKETSAGTMPFHKFGNKLHFRKPELLAWAESRLINGNAIGHLPVEEKKGGRR